jgi:hypothetical protein
MSKHKRSSQEKSAVTPVGRRLLKHDIALGPLSARRVSDEHRAMNWSLDTCWGMYFSRTVFFKYIVSIVDER